MSQDVETLHVWCSLPDCASNGPQDILTEALSGPWSPAQVEILEQTCGSETVLEAVKRTEAELSQRALGVPVARVSGDSAASSTTAGYSPPEVLPSQSAMLYGSRPPLALASA